MARLATGQAIVDSDGPALISVRIEPGEESWPWPFPTLESLANRLAESPLPG